MDVHTYRIGRGIQTKKSKRTLKKNKIPNKKLKTSFGGQISWLILREGGVYDQEFEILKVDNSVNELTRHWAFINFVDAAIALSQMILFSHKGQRASVIFFLLYSNTLILAWVLFHRPFTKSHVSVYDVLTIMMLSDRSE